MTRRTTDDDAQREADTRMARDLQAQIMADINRVLDHHQYLDGEHGPVFLRFIALAALTEVHGQRLADAIIEEPDRAKPWAAESLARLSLFVGNVGQQRFH